MTKLLPYRKEDMQKTTTIDHGTVLQAALLGYELQRNRIEAAMRAIQAELGQGGARPSTATATDSSEPKPPRKKRFSAAARKRMAAAQRKRWQLLKAEKTEAAKPKHKKAAKRRKANATAPRKQRPVQVKAAKKVARKVVKPVSKPKAKKAAPKPKKSPAKAPNAPVETTETPIQVAVEPAPATA